MSVTFNVQVTFTLSSSPNLDFFNDNSSETLLVSLAFNNVFVSKVFSTLKYSFSPKQLISILAS